MRAPPFGGIESSRPGSLCVPLRPLRLCVEMLQYQQKQESST